MAECDPEADRSPELIYPHRYGGRPVGNPGNCCRGVEKRSPTVALCKQEARRAWRGNTHTSSSAVSLIVLLVTQHKALRTWLRHAEGECKKSLCVRRRRVSSGSERRGCASRKISYSVRRANRNRDEELPEGEDSAVSVVYD